MRFRALWMAGCAGLLQVAIALTHSDRMICTLGSACFLLLFFWLNRYLRGMLLTLLGSLLNLIAMASNGGSMPLSAAAYARMSGAQVTNSYILWSKDVITDHAVLAWLGDRFVLPVPLSHLAVWSIGDMLLVAGITYMLWSRMKGTQHDRYGIRAAVPRAQSPDLRSRQQSAAGSDAAANT